jgi:MFS superfamily sulfate permease-like transporter
MTFLCCLLLGLDYGMIVGIVVNAMLLLNYAAKPKLDVQDLKV